jgi:hypothetical protein
MTIRVEEYIRPDRASPYSEWFDSLDVRAAAKALHAEYKTRKTIPPIDDNIKMRKM